MERLPEELIAMIAGYLPKKGLAPYATLSTRWQRVIERRTFSKLHVKSTNEDMEILRLLLNSHRLTYLNELYFTVVVSFNEASIKQRNQQEAQFSAAFTEALRHLFLVLSQDVYPATSGSKSKMLLQISGVKSVLDTWDQPSKYLAQHIGLVGVESLPTVGCISRLGLCDSDRKVALRAGIELSTRLPNVRSIDLETVEQDLARITKNAVSLRENRRNLAEALAKTKLIARLIQGQFSLKTDDIEATDLLFKPRFAFPNCHANPAAPSYDPLGVAIRTLSQNLTSLNLCGTFDAALFWPSEAEPGDTIATTSSISALWPHLKHMTVKLGICTPDGGWHFKAKPGAMTRRGSWPPPLNIPCEETMQPLFASWSKALSQMPVLQSATIWFHVEMMMPTPGFDPPEQRAVDKWIVGFQAPGVIPDPTIYSFPRRRVTMSELQSPRLIFERTNSWRPMKATMMDLYEMAKQKFPSKTMVEFDVNISNRVIRR
ncbi:hypothetical protein JX266_009541 [Neoarthrinium moseri]|nr:hypothetical protein JX266_009541 [Neoarthrinium moseri]